jgi:hypothetical protein
VCGGVYAAITISPVALSEAGFGWVQCAQIFSGSMSSWWTEYFMLLDVHTLGFMVYLAYPAAALLISLALWVT